jgi:hypothetical protein
LGNLPVGSITRHVVGDGRPLAEADDLDEPLEQAVFFVGEGQVANIGVNIGESLSARVIISGI